MNSTLLSPIVIIGAGQMGSGIALTCASKGFKVYLTDSNEAALKKAEQGLAATASKLQTQGILSASEEASLTKNLGFLPRFEQQDCGLVIEAATENEAIKTAIFADLHKRLPPRCIFASNTSSLSITRLAAAVSHPERFIGMHFMNPVPKMRLLEIIPGLATSTTTLSTMQSFARQLNKEVVISRDYPGFIVNRVLMPMINEAFTVLMEGIASREEIDLAMKLGTNQPMGPLALADYIGLDTCLSILEIMHQDLASSRFKPCPLLRQYVAAHWLGRKTGRGVYVYER